MIRKGLILLAIVGVLIFVLAGCAPAAPPAEKPRVETILWKYACYSSPTSYYAQNIDGLFEDVATSSEGRFKCERFWAEALAPATRRRTMDVMQNLRQKLHELPKEQLLDYIEMQFKNLWTLQNNYMARLEERFGHDVAIEFDNMCFGRMAEVAYYRLKKFFNLGDDIEALLTCKQYFVAEPGTEGEWFRVADKKIVSRITKCAMQLERKKRSAPELPCKPALIGVMDRAFKAVNPKFKIVRCMAPPDLHPENVWCEMEVELEE